MKRIPLTLYVIAGIVVLLFLITYCKGTSWPIPGSPCNNARSILPGQTDTFTTEGGGNDFSSSKYQGCLQSIKDPCNYEAEEILHTFSLEEATEVTLSVDVRKSNNLDGLGIFLFDQKPCDEAAECIAFREGGGNASLHLGPVFLDKGTYFFIIDQKRCAEKAGISVATEYTVSMNVAKVAPPCLNARKINCGVTLKGEEISNASNEMSSYKCAGARPGNFDAPENSYQFSLKDSSVVRIELRNFSSKDNFDLFLLDGCDPGRCLYSSTNSKGIGERILAALAPGSYYLIVDGEKGTAGAYDLSVIWNECYPQPTVCDLGGRFISNGTMIADTLTEFDHPPSSLYNVDCVSGVLGGQSPDRLYGHTYVYYHSEETPFSVQFQAESSGQTWVSAFRCDCSGVPDKACTQTCLSVAGESEPLNMREAEPGFYYIVVFSTQMNNYRMLIPSRSPCNIADRVPETIPLNKPLSLDLKGQENNFSTHNEEFNPYANWYAGHRNYSGEDVIFQFELSVPSNVQITLNAASDMGVFLYDYQCGQNIIAYAETSMEKPENTTPNRFLPTGTYYAIVDMEDSEQGSDFTINALVEASSDLLTVADSVALEMCEVIDSSIHEVHFAASVDQSQIGEELIQPGDIIHFFTWVDSDSTKLVIDTPWQGNQIFVDLREDNSPSPFKCNYEVGENFILAVEKSSGNLHSVWGHYANILEPIVNAKGYFRTDGASSILRLTDDPTTLPLRLIVDAYYKPLSSGAGNTFIGITSNVSWEVVGGSWINLPSKTPGNGDSTLVISYDANLSGNTRMDTIFVEGSNALRQRVIFIQDP